MGNKLVTPDAREQPPMTASANSNLPTMNGHPTPNVSAGVIGGASPISESGGSSHSTTSFVSLQPLPLPEKSQTLLQQFMDEVRKQEKAEQKADTFMRRVALILEKYPSCKGDDNQLIYRYWREYHPEVRMTFPQFEKLMSLTRAESIVRFRRWINERGIVVDGQLKTYLPTPETTSKRRAMCGRVERVMLERGI